MIYKASALTGEPVGGAATLGSSMPDTRDDEGTSFSGGTSTKHDEYSPSPTRKYFTTMSLVLVVFATFLLLGYELGQVVDFERDAVKLSSNTQKIDHVSSSQQQQQMQEMLMVALQEEVDMLKLKVDILESGTAGQYAYGANITHGHTANMARLAIATAFSANHKLEAVAMLKALIASGFTGTVYAFLMPEPGAKPNWVDDLKHEIVNMPLSVNLIEFPITDSLKTYCFKPKAMASFFNRNDQLPLDSRANVVMWADASTRYWQNPLVWANRMIRDGVEFAARKTVWSIPGETHPETFAYLNLNPVDFIKDTSIAATHFLVNLEKERFQHEVVSKWIDCARNCTTCMAPPGSTKKGGTGPGFGKDPLQFRAHRQDQAVLGALVYNYVHLHKDANVTLDHPSPYFCTGTARGGHLKSVTDWKQDLVIGGVSPKCQK